MIVPEPGTAASRLVVAVTWMRPRAADDRVHVAGGELADLGLAVAVDRDVEPVRAAILEPPSSGWPTPRDRAGGRRRPVPRPAHGAWPGPGLRAWCCH